MPVPGPKRRVALALAAVAVTGLVAMRPSLVPTPPPPTRTAGPERPRPPASPTAASPATVQSDDPLAVAGAVAVALYDTEAAGSIQAMLSRHGRRLFATFASPPGKPARASVAAVQLLDPRASAVVVQVEVSRWWLEGGTQVADSVRHVVLVTMWRAPDGRWLVDDMDIVS